MVTKSGPTFPQTGRILGPTGQSKRYHEEGGRVSLATASDLGGTDCLYFNFLAYDFRGHAFLVDPSVID